MSPEEYINHRERVFYRSEHPLTGEREERDDNQTTLSQWGGVRA